MNEPRQIHTRRARVGQCHCAKCGSKEKDSRQLAALEDIAKSLRTVAAVLRNSEYTSNGHLR
jgi:hypothetical protein